MSELIVVAGPTASGKTTLALDLADYLGGPERVEIVNADSMQVYRGMDIGTAKIPIDQRRGITHHLFDVWPVSHGVTVAEYQHLARATIADIVTRGKAPILVGGSGLYITATIDDLRFPGTDPQVRARYEQLLVDEGPHALHRLLHSRDPEAAERILPSNGRRIVRALEVIEITGAPFTASLPQTASPVIDARQIAIDWPTDALYERIELRVEQMWEQGLVEEVRSLRPEIDQARTASRALGYAQVLAFLRGEIDEQQARDDTVTATRRFARRQRSWLARDRRVRWIQADGPDLLAAALQEIGT